MSDGTSKLSFELRIDADLVTVALLGPLCWDTSAALSTEVAHLLVVAAGRAVCVDLSEVDDLDDAGASALYRWCARLATAGRPLRLASPSPAVQDFASLSGYQMRGRWPDVATAHGPDEDLGGDGLATSPLFDAMTTSEVLLLASRAMVRAGADGATSHLSVNRSELTLIGRVGCSGEFVKHFGLLCDWSTPCSLAATINRIVEIGNVATDALLVESEVGEVLLASGARSCASIPLSDGTGGVRGVVSAYWDRPDHRLTPELRAVAAHARDRLRVARPTEREDAVSDPIREIANLQRALDTRSVISTAVGIIMVSSQLTEREAFAELAHASQNTNTRLVDVAGQLVHRRNTRTKRSRTIWRSPRCDHLPRLSGPTRFRGDEGKGRCSGRCRWSSRGVRRPWP